MTPLVIAYANTESDNNRDIHDNSIGCTHSCIGPTTETKNVDCATGYTGSITQTRTKSSYPECSWGNWTETSNTCKPITFTVTASAGTNGTITPATQTANTGTTVSFTVTPSTGYTTTMGGTCPAGTLVGTTYTTGNITADCTVTASFTANSQEVDVCKNIEGIQTTIPNGFVKNVAGECVAFVTHVGGGGGFIRPPTIEPKGEVLGASTTCGIYVDKFLKIGLKGNNKEAVIKVQKFLNQYLNTNLVIDGIFGIKTDAALREFQSKHADKILTPWKLGTPTGIFYLTTQTAVNNIMCPPLNLPIPTLIPIPQNSSFPQF